MSRLVLDTNVVVSAMLVPYSNEDLVLRLALTSAHTLFVSDAVIEEYRRVLAKPKLKFRPMEIEGVLKALHLKAEVVNPLHRLHVSPDEPDNRLLECAESASADYLVTGNKRHFPLKWKGTAIMNAREWLETALPF